MSNALRDVAYTLRGFKRAPLVALTIVATVGLGLGLVTVAFTLLNSVLFRVDQVPDVHEMVGVERPRTPDGELQRLTRAEFDALRRETDVFIGVSALVSDVESRLDGRRMSGTFVTGNFFQLLRVKAAMGQAFKGGDDEPATAQPIMVLSHRGWDRLFARDPAIVGRQLIVNQVTFTVVGVMPEGFRGLTVTPDDYWAPLSLITHVRPGDRGREASLSVDIVGRLKPGVSQQAALAGLAVWDRARPSASPLPAGAVNITIVPRRGTLPQPLEALAVTAPLFFAFGLILLIGCANVTNLLLARGVARQREIGIRLSLGATRRRLIRQLLTESLLLALLAAAAGYAISRVALEVIVNAVMASWPPEIGDLRLQVPGADWRVMLFLVAGAAASTMFFGLVPALQATRIEPVRTIRGRARNLLIGLQVSASALLLISAAVFLRSALATTTFDPGLRVSDTIIVPIVNESSRQAIVQAVTTDPSVAAVAASFPVFDGPMALAEAGNVKTSISYRFVSPEYFGVLDIAVVRGRPFTIAERSASLSVAVVSETTARTLWPNREAVGEIVRLEAEPPAGTAAVDGPLFESRGFTVVGVVRDVAGLRIAPLDKAVIYVPTSATMAETSLVARLHGDPDVSRRALVDRLTSIDPNLGQVESLQWVSRMERYLLSLGFWLTVGLGALALVLTLSGLFSVLSYLVEQRRREIGVRMALGATALDVTRLVLSQSIRPVGAGLLVGAGVAAGLAALLLSTPAAGPIGEIVHVLDPVAYIASLAVVIAACLAAALIPAARAARLDPTQTLRQE